MKKYMNKNTHLLVRMCYQQGLDSSQLPGSNVSAARWRTAPVDARGGSAAQRQLFNYSFQSI